MRLIRCPVCGARGDASDDVNFELRGQVSGRPVRKCLSCGAGLLIKAFGKPDLIPSEIWAKMEAEWTRNFESDDPGPADVALEKAADDLIASIEDSDIPAIMKILFGLAFQFARTPLGWVMTTEDQPLAERSDEIDEGGFRELVALAGLNFTLLFLRDAENRSATLDAVDMGSLSPEQYVGSVFAKIAPDLEDEGRALTSTVDEPSRYAIAAYRRAVEGAFDEEWDDIDIAEALIFSKAFAAHFPAFDQGFWQYVNSK